MNNVNQFYLINETNLYHAVFIRYFKIYRSIFLDDSSAALETVIVDSTICKANFFRDFLGKRVKHTHTLGKLTKMAGPNYINLINTQSHELY